MPDLFVPGRVLAFATFTYGHGPGPEFTRWDMRDNQGRTMAHYAATHGKLPEGFDRWGNRTPDGATVAHTVACMQDLPVDFDQWSLEDGDGKTVREISDKYEAQRLGRTCRGLGMKT
jgi:hypothetical protein